MINLLFEVGHLYHRAALDPLYQVFRQDTQYAIAFTCSHDAERRFGLFNRSLQGELEARFRAEGLTIADDTRGFDVVITGDTVREPQRYGETLLCFVNHGTGIKNIMYRNLRAQAQTRYQVFVEGQYRVDCLQRANALGCSSVHKVGLPKLDPLWWPGFPSREALLHRLGLDPTRPTVLFAPTYKPTCLDQIREAILPATTDYNLIIKLHQYSWRGKYAPHWHHTIYERAVPHYPHAVLVPVDDYNIVPYMHAADVLISEASSTMFDFVALQKPGIVFVLPGAPESHHDGEALLTEDPQRFFAEAALHIRHASELGPAIAEALQTAPQRREGAQRLREYLFHGLDGQASQRTKAVIAGLLAEGRPGARQDHMV